MDITRDFYSLILGSNPSSLTNKATIDLYLIGDVSNCPKGKSSTGCYDRGNKT